MVRCEPQPTAVPAARYEIVQVDYLFCLMVADLDPENCTFSPVMQDVNGTSVLRPIQPAHGSFGKLGPFLRLEVKQEKLRGVSGECNNISTVWRPSGREKTL